MTATKASTRLPTKPEADRTRRLARLGEEIDCIICETERSITQAAIDIGYRLIEAKALAAHGEWMPWLAERGINQRTANRAMDLARKHKELVDTDWTRVSNFVALSYRQALALAQEDRRKSGKPRPRSKGKGGETPAQPEIEPPDPVYSLHHLAQRWSVDAIGHYQLTDQQAELLAADLPQLILPLVELCERHDIETGLRAVEAATVPEDPLTAVVQAARAAARAGCANPVIMAHVAVALGLADQVPHGFTVMIKPNEPPGAQAIEPDQAAADSSITTDPMGELAVDPVGELRGPGAKVPLLDPAVLRRWIEAALETGSWDAAALARHASTGAPKRGQVTAADAEKFVAGRSLSYHKRAALQRALQDIADHVPCPEA